MEGVRTLLVSSQIVSCELYVSNGEFLRSCDPVSSE